MCYFTIAIMMRISFPALAPEPLFITVKVLPGHSLLADLTQPQACELETGTNTFWNCSSNHLLVNIAVWKT